jgi:hypothetical protein
MQPVIIAAALRHGDAAPARASTTDTETEVTGTIPTNISADVIGVGFGKGGKTAAHVLTDAGKRVILIGLDVAAGRDRGAAAVPIPSARRRGLVDRTVYQLGI